MEKLKKTMEQLKKTRETLKKTMKKLIRNFLVWYGPPGYCGQIGNRHLTLPPLSPPDVRVSLVLAYLGIYFFFWCKFYYFFWCVYHVEILDSSIEVQGNIFFWCKSIFILILMGIFFFDAFLFFFFDPSPPGRPPKPNGCRQKRWGVVCSCCVCPGPAIVHPIPKHRGCEEMPSAPLHQKPWLSIGSVPVGYHTVVFFLIRWDMWDDHTPCGQIGIFHILYVTVALYHHFRIVNYVHLPFLMSKQHPNHFFLLLKLLQIKNWTGVALPFCLGWAQLDS